MVGRFGEIEQTEGGFCCIVFHGVRGQREVLRILSAVATGNFVVIVVVVCVGEELREWAVRVDSFADEKNANIHKHTITVAPFTSSRLS